MSTVKDGQLCWGVIAMGTSTVFEIWEAARLNKALPEYAGFDLASVIMVMLAAMLIAAGGAAFSTPLRPQGGVAGIKAWVHYYKMFVASVFMALIAAFAYTNIHTSIPR